MPRFIFIRIFLLFGVSILYIQSYSQCPTAQPGLLGGQLQTIGLNDTSDVPVYSTIPSGLPNTEYVFIHANSMADDSLGPAMIGTDTIGAFIPVQFGLNYCDEVHVIPFSYDLMQVRELVDSLLFAYYLAPTTTCCDASTSFFPGLCDTINALGIYSGNDVHSLDDLIDVLSIFMGTGDFTTSLENLTMSIDLINSIFPLLGSCAGSVGEICYAVENSNIAKDMYSIRLANAAQEIDIIGDTITFNGQALSLNISFLPTTSTDSLIWSTSSTQSIILVDSTGIIQASTGTDSVYVFVNGYYGCASDSIWVILDPTVNLNILDGVEYLIYPNPCQDFICIQNPISNIPISYSLVTMQGQFLDQKIDVTGSTIKIDVKELVSGYYTLLLYSGEWIQRSIILKE